jgi:hypothetical protein
MTYPLTALALSRQVDEMGYAQIQACDGGKAVLVIGTIIVDGVSGLFRLIRIVNFCTRAGCARRIKLSGAARPTDCFLKWELNL